MEEMVSHPMWVEIVLQQDLQVVPSPVPMQSVPLAMTRVALGPAVELVPEAVPVR